MLNKILTWTSAVIVRKQSIINVGCFPVGMVGGEDLYVWCKLVSNYKLAYANSSLAVYNIKDSGVAIRRRQSDTSQEDWSDLFKAGDYFRNEYIAMKGLENGIRQIFSGNKERATKMLVFFRYTRMFKMRLIFLRVLCYLPRPFVDIVFLIKTLKSN